MSEKKKISIFIKIIFIFLVILILFFVSLYLFYIITREDERKYISTNYFVYIKVDSISKLYNNIIDLRALDVLLVSKEYKDLYKVLLEFKNSSISKNRLLSKMLDMKVNIILDHRYNPSILLNMGFKSIFFKLSGIASKIFQNNEEFNLKEFKKSDYKYYKLTLVKSNITIYYSIKGNLLFLGLNEESIDNFYSVSKSTTKIIDDPDFFYIKSQVRKDGIAEIFVNTEVLFDSFLKNNQYLKNIIEKFTLYRNSALSLNISNSEIFLSTFTKSSTEDPLIKNFITQKPPESGITKYLPIDTNFYTSLNFESFEEFYKLILYLQEGKFDKTIENINNTSKVLLNLSINELLFDWIGEEIGLFTTDGIDYPAIFIKIKSKQKLENVFNKLTESIFLEESVELKYKDVQLKKIILPEFLNQIISLFVKNFDTPFFVIQDDYIFFSMDIEPLANLILKYKDDKTIIFDKDFKNATSKVNKNSNVFTYFNMSYSIPKILQGKGIIQDLLQLYEKGVMTINISDSSVKIDFSANGTNVKKTRAFSGYPLKLDEELYSDLLIYDIAGSKLPELIYTTKNKRLYVADFKNSVLSNFPVKINDNSDKILVWDKEIIAYTDSGFIHKFDINGNEKPPFPLDTGIKNSFAPLIYNNKLLLYSKEEKKLIFIDKNGEKEIFNYEFNSPILSTPAVYNDILFVYPKSFSGTIFAIDKDGNDLKGWPQDAGGIAFGSPVVIDRNKMVIFITQGGDLKAWDIKGIPKEELNQKIEGVYYTQPVVGDITEDKGLEIVTLSKDGTVTILSSNGNIIAQKKIKEASGEGRRLLLFNATKDKYEEIFIYGEKNSIIALDGNLDILPGFPIKGSNKPYFFDLNGDEEYEIISGSYDNHIYIYSIPK